jgi:hypothetical protein
MKKFIIITVLAGFLIAQAPVKALTTLNHGALAQATVAQNVAAKAGENKAQELVELKKICEKTNKLTKIVKYLAMSGGITLVALTTLAIAYDVTPEYLISLAPESFNTVVNYCGTTPGYLMSYMPKSLTGYLTPVCNVGSAVNSTSNTCEQIVCEAGQKLVESTCQNICPQGYFGFVADKCYKIGKACPELCSTVSNGIGSITETGACRFYGSKALETEAPTLLDHAANSFYKFFGWN